MYQDVPGNGVLAETEGFEPSIRFWAYDDLANRCLQPLGHVSANQKVTPYRGAEYAMQEHNIGHGFLAARHLDLARVCGL